MKYFKLLLFLILSINVFSQNTEFRAWQFHALDTAYMNKALKVAPDYDINAVIMSHGAIGYAQQLFNEPYEQKTKSEKGLKLEAVSQRAKHLGIDAYLWVHELGDIPEKFKKGEEVFLKHLNKKSKKVDLDNRHLWKYLEKRYEKVLSMYPTFAGFMITFHETHYKIFNDDEVISKMDKDKRFSKLINLIYKVCKKYNKQLIVRSFLYQKEEYEWFSKGLESVPEDVLLQVKCVPNDWQPFFPHNSLIGQFPERKQIIEYDASAEYMGRNFIVWAAPHYFQYRWKHAAQYPQVVGYNVRLDHAGYDALFTPNEINIYALSKLMNNPDYDMDKFWKEWATKYYGEKASDAAIAILKPTYDMVNKLYFPQGVWFGNHSKLTHYEYAERRIDYIAHWDDSWQPLVDELMNPTEATLLRLIAEKDEALMLTQQSLWKLHESRELFREKDYQDLNERLLFQLHLTMLYKSNVKLYWGVKLAKKDPSYVAFVKNELKVFRAYAQVIPEFIKQKKKNYILDPLVVEKVAKSIEKKLDQP